MKIETAASIAPDPIDPRYRPEAIFRALTDAIVGFRLGRAETDDLLGLALRAMLRAIPPTTELTLRQVAVVLGVSEEFVRHLRQSGQLPAIKRGGPVRFAAGDVRTWLELRAERRRERNRFVECDLLSFLDE